MESLEPLLGLHKNQCRDISNGDIAELWVKPYLKLFFFLTSKYVCAKILTKQNFRRNFSALQPKDFWPIEWQKMSNSLRANIEIYEKLNYTLSEVKSLSHVRLFATPGTVAYQAPPSMGFSKQEYWSGFSKLLMYSSTQEISEHLLYARYCSRTLEVVAINNFF